MWLESFDGLVSNNLYNEESTGISRFMSLFAIAGTIRAIEVYKAEMSGVSILPEINQTLNRLCAIIFQVFTRLTSNSLPLLCEDRDQSQNWWRIAIAVACAESASPSSPLYQTLPISFSELILDVFFNDVIGSLYIFDELSCGFDGTIKRMEAHKSSKLFRQESASFGMSIGEIFKRESLENQDKILKEMKGYSHQLFQQWRTTFLANSERQTLLKSTTQEEKENGRVAKMQMEQLTFFILPLFQSNFLVYTMIFKAMSEGNEGDFTSDQIVSILTCYANLNFCRVDFPAYEQLSKSLIDGLIEEPEQKDRELFTNEMAMRMFEILPRDLFSQHFKVDAKGVEDQIELSRIYFLLSVLEKTIPHFSQSQLEEKIVPFLFGGLECSHQVLNTFTHELFRQVFSIPLSGRNRTNLEPPPIQSLILPSYVTISLKNFPNITPLESFDRSIAAALQNHSKSQTLRGVSHQVSQRLHKVSLHVVNQLYKVCKGFLKSDPKRNAAFCSILTSQLNNVDFKQLTHLHEKIEELIYMNESDSVENYAVQLQLLRLCHESISQSYDYSRKNANLRWYLRQLEALRVVNDNPGYIPSPFPSMM
eukprot:TRINITY_DN3277_c0_g2_i1.p2 TRINITY_DN3277_c0_g2~~TRINITY_DN3277_c0_g2_i1.p2  ORF type:complete len:634 (-),score=225.36 TRINITY_DN3277_c0_g2_i1:2390-4168(-)